MVAYSCLVCSGPCIGGVRGRAYCSSRCSMLVSRAIRSRLSERCRLSGWLAAQILDFRISFLGENDFEWADIETLDARDLRQGRWLEGLWWTLVRVCGSPDDALQVLHHACNREGQS